MIERILEVSVSADMFFIFTAFLPVLCSTITWTNASQWGYYETISYTITILNIITKITTLQIVTRGKLQVIPSVPDIKKSVAAVSNPEYYTL